ncbi:CRISPR-associated protein Cas6 [Nonomuraea sp. FMUSA5-5]|uniref:CRISPR-associated protein Cas6 n=1 Tax=Nonomuraea composti TaxID=2720023 RepID=A0ABX1BN19_9ACTN|nr:CRISPR-associated endoribonuclease Cas6 [Nonomuraea sp. FMUSA5-5]NJP97979.1 CRISPR-associated protein Cas6 [Nonomuraea sp. FMUSA5-5]
MRVRVEVSTTATDIPWDMVLAPGRGLVYDVLDRENPVVGRYFHDGGMAPYGMVPIGHGAPVFPLAKRQRGKYAAGGQGWFEVGSPVLDVAAALVQGIKQRALLDWGGVAFHVLGVTALDPPEFTSGRARLRTITPVVMKGSGRDATGARTTRHAWLLPTDSEYPAYFQGNLRRKAETLGLDADVSLTRISWVGSKRSFRVGEGLKPGAPVEVEVTGAPETLRAIWSWGLGQANAAGFGWVAA